MSSVFKRPAIRNSIALIVGLGITALAFFTLSRLLSETPLDQVASAIKAMPWSTLGAALAFTALSFMAMAAYDVIAVENTAPGRISPAISALVGAGGYAISNALGFPFLTGGAIRYRVYRRFGFEPVDVARIVGISWFALWFALALMVGVALVADPGDVPLLDTLPRAVDIALGAILIACVAILVTWLATGRRQVRIRSWTLLLPNGWAALAQVAAGVVDVAAAAAVLYVLMPEDAVGSFTLFAIVFAMATVAGVVSNAPAGLGAFEATIIGTLGLGSNPDALAAVVVYRIIYTVLPLIVTMFGLALSEIALQRHVVRGQLATAAKLVEPMAPPLTASLSFLGGVVLLVSGATPGLEGRIGILADILPLPFIELSHLAASLVGVGLLIIARGLARRLWRAYVLALVLMLAGAVLSIAKGLDWEEATALLSFAIFLVVFRRAFYRRADDAPLALNWRWLATVAAALIGCGWLGMFAYSHVEYANAMWWDFALDGDAPRFLRAGLVVFLVMAAAGLELWIHQRHRPSSGQPIPDAVRTVVATSSSTTANLALLGDKQFLMADDGSGFVMYGQSGGSLIALGEPVAPAAKVDELAWAFRDLADRKALRPVFYEVSADRLPLFLDMGLTALKLGEVARVDLTSFTLSGPKRQDMRTAMRKAEREGLEFSILPAAEVPAAIEELRLVSDAWLEMKSGAEKSFSLGYFDADYLANFDHAVMRKEGHIVAFANLWRSGDKSEISIDLMRHLPDVSRGVMDALFGHVLMAGKDEGYLWFDLGAAPLSGLSDRRGASRWNRFGSMVYRRGGDLYSFDGLRAFKQKFQPIWTPHYLICPRGLDTAKALIDVTALISRRPAERNNA
ncbi:bifunctional lysylphosphatidylglycerol flippase/synthetase MprF [Aureimonas altamirensis]|nr:bifunctional lysylphosphatidylglycerol flippase/synthetase MprF [Aureimonas altamirensis]